MSQTQPPASSGDEPVLIKVGDQTCTIEGRPLNLICKSPDLDLGPPLEYPGRLVIDPATAINHADLLKIPHAEARVAWVWFHAHTGPGDPTKAQQLVPPLLSQTLAEDVRRMSIQARQVFGFIDLELKLSDMGVPMVWREPTAGLHPAWAVAIADLAIWFMGRARGCTPELPPPIPKA